MNWRVLIAGLLLGATAVRAEEDRTAILVDFTNVTAGQYQVLAQSGRPIGTQVNWFMNQMLQQYSRFFSNWSPKAPARVIVFDNVADFQQYATGATRELHGGLAGYCGLVTDSAGNQFHEVVTFEQDNLWGILAHEGFHQFLAYELGQQAPLWLNEGLAQYFETSTIAHGRLLSGQINKPKLLAARLLIRSGQAPPIGTLIGLDRAAFYSNPQANYPLSWALVYYLLQREERSYHDSALRRYFYDLKLGKNPITSFASRFGRDQQQLQTDFEQYILRLPVTAE